MSRALDSTASLNDDVSIIVKNLQLILRNGIGESFSAPSKLREMLSHFQGSNQSGASRLSSALGNTPSLNNDVSIIVNTLQLIMRNGIGESFSARLKKKAKAFTFIGLQPNGKQPDRGIQVEQCTGKHTQSQR